MNEIMSFQKQQFEARVAILSQNARAEIETKWNHFFKTFHSKINFSFKEIFELIKDVKSEQGKMAQTMKKLFKHMFSRNFWANQVILLHLLGIFWNK